MKPNQAGKSIYQLGHRRLGKAIGYYLASGGLCAAFVVIFPVFLFSAIGLILYLGLGGAAYLLYIQGAILNKSTQWPYQGAAAKKNGGR